MSDHEIRLDTDNIDPTDQSDLERLAEQCDRQIDWLSYKITEGRIHDHESFAARLKAIRALSTMVRTRLQVEEAKELDAFRHELAETKAILEDGERT